MFPSISWLKLLTSTTGFKLFVSFVPFAACKFGNTYFKENIMRKVICKYFILNIFYVFVIPAFAQQGEMQYPPKESNVYISAQSLKRGIEYFYYDRCNGCKIDPKKVWLSENEYKALCENAFLSDFGGNVLTSLTHTGRELYQNGEIEDLKIFWDPSQTKYKCRVNITMYGILNGSSKRLTVNGSASTFKLSSEGKIMITHASSMD